MARTPRTTTTDPVDPNVIDENDPTIQGQDQNDLDGTSQGDSSDEPNADDAEQAEPDSTEGESATPSDEMLDAIDELEARKEKRDNADIAASEQKLLEVVIAYPDTTPNEHTAFGFGGKVITLGDLRNIAAGIRDKYRA